MSADPETSPAPLQIEVPASQAEAGLRALVRVSCKGWSRLRIRVAGEPMRTRWLGPGRHDLSFMATFGEPVLVERTSLLGRHCQTVNPPAPHWFLRALALQSRAELRDLSSDLKVPPARFKDSALEPSFKAERVEFNLRPDGLTLWPPGHGAHPVEPILQGPLQQRLSIPLAEVSSEAITLNLDAQAIEPVIPDLNLGHPNPGGLPESTRMQDQQGAPR